MKLMMSRLRNRFFIHKLMEISRLSHQVHEGRIIGHLLSDYIGRQRTRHFPGKNS